jgi:hypothetical protein
MNSTHMLLRKWNQPLWTNMWVNRGVQVSGLSRWKFTGTRPTIETKLSNPAGDWLSS